MEHLTFKGTAGYPSTRAISEAIEGVGGSFNRATDRESTVYWVRVPGREADDGDGGPGRAHRPPALDENEIDGEREVIVEEIRSYLDDPAEYAQILFQQAMFGDGRARPRDLRRRGRASALAADETIRDFWRTMYRPANTVVAVAGDLSHDEAVGLAGRRSGPATASMPGSRRRPRCRPASASSAPAERARPSS